MSNIEYRMSKSEVRGHARGEAADFDICYSSFDIRHGKLGTGPTFRREKWGLSLVFLLPFVVLSFLLAGATPARAQAPAYGTLGPVPQSAGHHDLYANVHWEANKPLKLPYSLYLPKGYESKMGKRAMVVFLLGAGEVSDKHEPIYVHGPAAELKRNKDLADWADFIVLSPQAPASQRWEQPAAGRVVLEMIELAKQTWRVDPNRIYLTGLSMGGAGTWRIGMDSNSTFAAIAPICAIEVEPNRAAKALKGTTCWIIGGGGDGGYTEGARKMYKALSAAGVDAVQTEVPERGHDVWASYYSARGFYEFLLLHQRGKAPPASRLTPEQLLRIAYTAPKSVDARLAEPFKKFLPYWILLNCGPDMEPGYKETLGGRSGVFVTHPLDAATSCRMLTTISVPKDKATSLDLVVGCHPQGQWQLVVRGNGQDLLTKMINPAAGGDPNRRPADANKAAGDASRPANDANRATLPGPSTRPAAATRPAGAAPLVKPPPVTPVWMNVSVDLTRFAGEDVRMELLNSATDNPLPAAYWGQVKVNSRTR